GAAALAMDDRDRAAPIALPRNAPVAQPVIDPTLRHWNRLCNAQHFAIIQLHPLPDDEIPAIRMRMTRQDAPLIGGIEFPANVEWRYWPAAGILDHWSDQGARILLRACGKHYFVPINLSFQASS